MIAALVLSAFAPTPTDPASAGSEVDGVWLIVGSGAFVVLGAVIAAGSSFLADSIRAKRDGRERLVQARIQAYAAYLAVLDDVSDIYQGCTERLNDDDTLARDESGDVILWRRIGGEEYETDLRVTYDTYLAQGARANACLAVVDLLAPHDVAQAASKAWDVAHLAIDNPERHAVMTGLIDTMKRDIGLPGHDRAIHSSAQRRVGA